MTREYIENFLWPEVTPQKFTFKSLCNYSGCFTFQKDNSGYCGMHEGRIRTRRNLMYLPFRLLALIYLAVWKRIEKPQPASVEMTAPVPGAWMD